MREQETSLTKSHLMLVCCLVCCLGTTALHLFLVDNQANKYCCDFQILTAPLSPNESFLRYLTLPQDNDLAIDLRQTAVVIMAHLDRLASPCSPPHCNSPTSHKVKTLFIYWQCLNDQLSYFSGQRLYSFLQLLLELCASLFMFLLYLGCVLCSRKYHV